MPIEKTPKNPLPRDYVPSEPNIIPGYTRPVPGNPIMTMIPGPVLVPGSYCYHTDQRDFSSEVDASSRMHSEARIEFRSGGPANKRQSWLTAKERIRIRQHDPTVGQFRIGKENMESLVD